MDSEDGSWYSEDVDIDDVPELPREREGALHYHMESSYAGDTWRSQYIRSVRRWKVWYERCKPHELRRFVVDRGLEDPFPKGVTLKYFYLRILDRADRAWRFRFQDLPPEMRLLVYRGLLSIPEPSQQQFLAGAPWDTHPAILQTSKEVYNEAKAELYDNNVFSVRFEAVAEDHGNVRKYVKVHKDRSAVVCAHERYFRMPDGIDDYPEFFRRISSLEIQVKYTIEGTEGVLGDGAWPLNNFLYTLASFLMDGHRIRSLHLDLDFDAEMEEFNFETTLYPLLRLRNIPNVTVSGQLPVRIKNKLISKLQSTEPAFNTMRLWKLLTDQAYTQLQIHEAMHDETECTCGECPLPDCIEELNFRMRILDERRSECSSTSRLEENFMARLAALRNVLKRVEAGELQSLVKDLAERQAALRKYEAVTDEGRLDEAAKIWTGETDDDAAKYDADDVWSDDDHASASGEPNTTDEDQALQRRRPISGNEDSHEKPPNTMPHSDPTLGIAESESL